MHGLTYTELEQEKIGVSVPTTLKFRLGSPEVVAFLYNNMAEGRKSMFQLRGFHSSQFQNGDQPEQRYTSFGAKKFSGDPGLKSAQKLKI